MGGLIVCRRLAPHWKANERRVLLGRGGGGGESQIGCQHMKKTSQRALHDFHTSEVMGAGVGGIVRVSGLKV